MAKIKGLCRNEDCEMCDQIQEAEKSNFVCEKCGKPLMPFGDKGQGAGWMKMHGKQVAIIVIALVIIAGGIFGGMALFSGKGDTPEPEPLPQIEEPADTAEIDTVAKADTVAAEPKTVEEPQTTAEEPEVKKPAVKTSKPVVHKDKTYGQVNLGYGVYVGDLKNGQPHGHGTITYSTRHRIVSSKDFYANPGDRFEGDFREGRISSIGYWYHDGEQTAIKP